MNMFDGVKIVAVKFSDGTWLAKFGPEKWEAEQVVFNGDVVPENLATWLFGDEARRCKLTWRG